MSLLCFLGFFFFVSSHVLVVLFVRFLCDSFLCSISLLLSDSLSCVLNSVL